MTKPRGVLLSEASGVSLVDYLTSVSKGTWWTRADPNPSEPSWGAKVVHVYIMRGGKGYAVTKFPDDAPEQTVPLKIGASRREIEDVAAELTALQR